MNIKFSHSYPKLWGQKKAVLIAVRIIDSKSVAINKDMIEYDTKYFMSVERGECKYGYYELPKSGMLIQLIFIGDKEIPFCTLRSNKPGKYEYYKKNIGKIFDIIIGDPKC